jgi:hypothetical protein
MEAMVYFLRVRMTWTRVYRQKPVTGIRMRIEMAA